MKQHGGRHLGRHMTVFAGSANAPSPLDHGSRVGKKRRSGTESGMGLEPPSSPLGWARDLIAMVAKIFCSLVSGMPRRLCEATPRRSNNWVETLSPPQFPYASLHRLFRSALRYELMAFFLARIFGCLQSGIFPRLMHGPLYRHGRGWAEMSLVGGRIPNGMPGVLIRWVHQGIPRPKSTSHLSIHFYAHCRTIAKLTVLNPSVAMQTEAGIRARSGHPYDFPR